MTDAASPLSRPIRRRQEDRRTETRRKLIDATIRCLHRVGYSAVTISMVATEAGVSRGIIGYHFPSKADLMVAVRDEVYADERQALEDVRESIGTLEYLRQLPQLTSTGMRKEASIAVSEILLAARADSELIAKLRKTEAEIEQRAMTRLEGLFEEVGIQPPKDLLTIMRMSVAMFRGLAMAELVQGEEAGTDASVAYFAGMIDREVELPATLRLKAAGRKR